MSDTSFFLSANWVLTTPTLILVGGSGNVVPQYTTKNFWWFRIGKMIFCMFIFSGDGGNEGAGTGQLNIPLPFTTSSAQSTGSFIIGNMINGATGNMVMGNLGPSVSTISLTRISAYSTLSTLTGADQNNTTRTLSGQFVYHIV